MKTMQLNNLAHKIANHGLSIFILTFLIFFETTSTAQQGEDGIRKIYLKETNNNYASLVVYSTESGKLEKFYFKDKQWHRMSAVPSPPVSITKGDLRMIYNTGTSDNYASVVVYSTKTGELEKFYYKDKQWHHMNSVPSPPVSITKGNLRMVYYTETSKNYASVVVYSTKTGELEKFYLKDKQWHRMSAVPSPPVSITKGDLRMVYYTETSDSYASVVVYSTKTGELEKFYLKDKQWHRMSAVPSPPVSITKGNLRMIYNTGTSKNYASVMVYSTTTGELEKFYLKDKQWHHMSAVPSPPVSITKGNLRMIYNTGTSKNYASVMVYSTKTGELEKFYFKDEQWHHMSSVPSPQITVMRK